MQEFISPKDEEACNSIHYQHKRQNSNMVDHSNNSIFLIRIDFLKTSQFLSSLQVKMEKTQVRNVGYNRLLAISERIPGLKMSGSLDGIQSQLDFKLSYCLLKTNFIPFVSFFHRLSTFNQLFFHPLIATCFEY